MGTAWWQTDWVWQVTGWVLCALGVGVMGWALLWDRAKGKRRCAKCWYDMTGVPGLRCPECGREAKREAGLLRTRRRWGWTPVAALLVAGAYPVSEVPRILRVGRFGAMPTTGLIYWVGKYEPAEVYLAGKMSAPTGAAKELARRVGAGELWGWQWRLMLRRLHIVRWRERWPVGTPWEVTLGEPSWLRSAANIKAKLPAHLWHSQVYPPDPSARSTDVMGIGMPTKTQPLMAGEDSVTLEISAGKWSGPMVLPVLQVGKVEEAMTLVREPQLDRAVRSALQASISRDKNAATKTDLMLGARLYREKGPVPEDLAIGLRVELRRDGEMVKSWPLRLSDSAFGPPVDWIRISMPEPGWKTEDAGEMARWRVRVCGDPGVALGDAAREKCWAGEYEVPLGEFLR